MKSLAIGVAVAVFAVVGVWWVGYSPEAPEAPMASEAGDMALTQTGQTLQTAGVIQVWKSPTCGCCSSWIEHLEAEGYEVESHDEVDMNSVKAQYGVPRDLQSCHTAVIDGYLIEGHVPAEDIARLLEERPQIAGLAVPGMPVGSPGMEMGDQVVPYDVVTFDGNGDTTVYSSHGR